MYTSQNFKTKKALKDAVERYNGLLVIANRRKRFYQDGRDFYDAETNVRVATYPELVKGDYDRDGAENALQEFRKSHPEYREVDFDANNASPVTIFAPGLGSPKHDGWETVEGPHYPEPHRWYAQVFMENGIVTKVK